ncbi:MAG: AMP-binding protein [Terriglobales bacterium]
MMTYPLTLAALLRRAERWFPSVELACGAERTCYAELAARARRLARALLASGLEPGDRVATLLWNDLTHWEAYFGVPLAGGIVHPINLRLHTRQWARILRQSGDRFAIIESSLLPRWEELDPDLRPPVVIVAPEAYEAWLDAAPELPLPELEENDGAAMGYTSGTTGEPKGVVYSHRALVLHALTLGLPDALNLRQRDCILPLVPMFHANAWGAPHAAAIVGCKQVLAGSSFDAETVLATLEREQVTRSAGVPMIWQGVLDLMERFPGKWKLHPELRVNLGGAAAPAELFRRFDRQRIEVNMGWGMTEMTPVGTMNPLLAPDGEPDFDQRRTRQGRPLPLVEGRTAPGGEFEVRGAWVADRYFGGVSPESFTADGWLRTGDIVAFDHDGLMQIVDRSKDLIRSGGEWISSVALENALACHPSVREAAVVAVPHPRWQERPLAVVALRAGAEPDPAAWRKYLETDFPAWQVPDRFELVDALPRTSTGKIDKRALRARFASRHAADTGR